MRGVTGQATRGRTFARPSAAPLYPTLGFAPLCGLAASLLLVLGCASDLVAVDGGFRHRQHGYSFAAPDGPGGPWERFEVAGTAIAFRRSGPETISVQSRCGRPVADAAIMARQLVIGISPRAMRQAGPVLVDGHSGWTQTFDTLRGDVGVRVKTVTLVLGRCTLDWVLAAAGSRPFEQVERAFDAWWQTFRMAPGADAPEAER